MTMNKRHLHHLWKTLQIVSYWHFFAVAIIAGVIFVLAYRQNNITALHLRDELLQVDKDNGDVETALRKLRGFTYAHMNTNLATGTSIYPPIQLKYRYERLVGAQKQAAAQDPVKIYTDAQNFCEKQVPTGLSGGGRVPCIQDYVSKHTVTAPQSVPDALYKFDFASPAWTPDGAGIGLMVAFLFLAFGVGRLLLELWFRHQLRHHE